VKFVISSLIEDAEYVHIEMNPEEYARLMAKALGPK